MKLYEINAAIEDLMNQMIVDSETGEVSADMDSIVEQLDTLEMERKDVLTYLAKVVLNLRADREALENEMARLAKRATGLKKREESIMAVLDRECAGQKTDLGVATVKYTKGRPLVIKDKEKAIDWLAALHSDMLRFPPPELDKQAVKALINSGEMVPGCTIEETTNCTLK